MAGWLEGRVQIRPLPIGSSRRDAVERHKHHLDRVGLYLRAVVLIRRRAANCRDVLNKLKRELERFRIASDADSIEDMKDAAFNASVTAWPLLRPFRDQWNLVELFKGPTPVGRQLRALFAIRSMLHDDRRADRYTVVEVDYILIAHAEAAGGHRLPYRLRLVRAVDAV